MLSRVVVAFLCIASAVFAGLTGALGQQREEFKVTILSPVDGAKVSQFEELEGRVKPREGWPVVLVQPLAPGQPWWVQASVEEVTDGKFTAKIQLGDEKSKGVKFRICVVLARDKAAAEKFAAGDTRNSLPAGLARSGYVTVVRE